MKRKLFALLLAAAFLGLCGCSLAREEAAGPEADRWIGFFVVPESEGEFISREGWTEYGGIDAETEFGTLSIPRDILIAERADLGRGREYAFPGMEGYRLFYLEYTDEYGHVNSVNSDMADGAFHIDEADGAHSVDLSGVIYYGAPLDQPDWDQWEDGPIWTYYRVFQMPDGTIYLDGSGDSSNGAGITYHRTEEYTREKTSGYQSDAETETMSIRVEVSVRVVPRLTALIVRQYGADGQLLQSGELPLDGAELVVDWRQDAAWAVVEEVSAEGVKRTSYDKPDGDADPVYHQIVLLDDDGLGHTAEVKFQ